jgi:ATP-binding cassette, subfamily F, member 3
MITVKNLSFGYATHKVLEDSSFTIPSRQKVALVGPNGAGKTTLLKIISGLEDPDGGQVQTIGRIGSVPQEVKYDSTLESVSSIRAYINPDDAKRDDELVQLMKGMELSQLSLDAAPQKLSGGQKTKLAFIRNIIAQPDILILDEPTNFLDIPGKRWVMNFLSKYPKTLLIVSHDIELLDQAIQKVLFVNTHSKKVEEYTGNYSKYLKLKKEREELVKRTRAAQEKEITRMKKGLAKIQGVQSEKGVRQKINLQNRIARMQDNLPELPPEIRTMRVTLPEPENVGRVVLQLTNVGKKFEKLKVLEQVNFMLERGEKMAIIGRNGAGKSTLLKIIMGKLESDTGRIEAHPDLNIGYYAQEHESFDLDKTLIDTVIDHVPSILEGYARALLGRFLFSGDRIYQKVGTLSGGEKTRLAIALLTIKGHNLLVLDEPTTYLDVLSQRIILEVLKDYKGAMIIVSHTEDFMKELAPNKGLILPDNKFDFWRPEMLDLISEI